MKNIYIGIGILAVTLAVAVYLGLPSMHTTESTEMEHGSEPVESYEIHPKDVVEKLSDDVQIIILDVRTKEQFEQQHVKNALLLPLSELSQQALNDIGIGGQQKNAEIIILGRSGTAGKKAYDMMSLLGYINVKSSSGGMIHWTEDNYPFTEVGESNTAKNEVVVENTSGPVISFNRTLHDFGEITQYGGVVETNFTVTNEGTETLEIGDITTSCSCASATIADSSIEAGDSTELTVVFDPDFHAEPKDVFTRTIFLPTNDPNAPEAEVVIQVDILEGV